MDAGSHEPEHGDGEERIGARCQRRFRSRARSRRIKAGDEVVVSCENAQGDGKERQRQLLAAIDSELENAHIESARQPFNKGNTARSISRSVRRAGHPHAGIGLEEAREQRSRRIADGLAGGELTTEIVATHSEVGGGAVPAEGIATFACALRHAKLPATELAAELRGLETPIVARIEDERVLLDPRSLDPSEDDECVSVIRARFGGPGGE